LLFEAGKPLDFSQKYKYMGFASYFVTDLSKDGT